MAYNRRVDIILDPAGQDVHSDLSKWRIGFSAPLATSRTSSHEVEVAGGEGASTQQLQAAVQDE